MACDNGKEELENFLKRVDEIGKHWSYSSRRKYWS